MARGAIGDENTSTGAAVLLAFILSRRMLNQSFRVIGLDNMNNYYNRNPGWRFLVGTIAYHFDLRTKRQ